MAFGQQSGPPATAKQLRELADRANAAGYDGLREARHPWGLSQRQAGGRFTRDEAEALLDRLRATEDGFSPSPVAGESPRTIASRQMLRIAPADELARELERRGWTVVPPP